MKFIKNFFAKLAEDRAQESYRDGFSWAMCAFYLEHKQLQEIENFASIGTAFNCETDHFGRGAKYAIRVIEGHAPVNATVTFDSKSAIEEIKTAIDELYENELKKGF